MAEVTGYLGDQPIELNNAATEETMKQLVAAIALMSSKMGADKKTQAQQTKELDKFFKQLGTTTDKMKKLNDQVDDAVALEKKANAAREAQIAGLKKLAGGLESAVGKLANIMNSFASMGSSISGAVSAMSTVNKNLGVVFAGVATSTERLMTTFQQTASAGANFNGSIREMTSAAAGAGLSYEQFSSVIAKNSQDLALFGGTAQEGAKRIAQMAKTLKTDIPKLSDDLARLGFSTTDVADNMAYYSSLMQRTGSARNMTDKQLIQTSAEYMKNLDMISRITGQNKQDLMAQREANKSDAAFRMLEQKAGGDAVNVQTLLSLLPAEFRDAGKTLMARKAPVTPESQALMQQFPDLAQKMINLGVQIDTTGKMSEADALNTYKLGLEESAYRKNQQRDFNEAAQYQDKYNNTIVGTIEFQQRAKDGVERAMQEQLKTLEKERTAGVDAAKIQELQQDIANDSNKATLTQAEQIDKLTTAYKTISSQLPVVTSLYQVMMANIGTVIIGLAAFNAALWAASNLPGGGGMGSPGGKGSRGGPKSGKGGMGKTLGKVGKFSVGGILGGLVLNQAANMATNSGHENIGAGLDIGGSALSMAGTGALIGSLFPGVGTAIGGVIGGVIGTGLGIWNNWGTITKKEIAAKQNTVAKEKELAQTIEEINRDRIAAEKSIDLNDPIALLLNEIKTVAPRVFEAFLRGNANGGVVSSGGGGYSGATGSNFIKKEEGVLLKAKYDAAGRHSIGYGHNITANEIQRGHIKLMDGSKIKLADDYRQTSITQEQADALFETDKGQYYAAARKGVGAEAWSKLNDNQKTALASYAYNTGGTADLAKKGLTDAIMSGDMNRASAIIAGGKNTSDGQVLDGLTARRGRESELFVSQTSLASAQMKSTPSNSSVGNPELDRIAADKLQKEENQKNIDKRYDLNKPYTAQDAAQKSAESNAGGVNNTTDNTSMMVTLQREHNTLLKEQNSLLKKGGWMAAPQH
jgi:GH24 family phage-related lysozyme (muramidase)